MTRISSPRSLLAKPQLVLLWFRVVPSAKVHDMLPLSVLLSDAQEEEWRAEKLQNRQEGMK